MRNLFLSLPFTFIELILVVLIIVALAGISIPRFKRAFDSLQLNSFASTLQDELGYWQERAIVEKKPIVLKLDSENNQYWVQAAGDDVRFKTYQIPSGISLAIEEGQCVFYPDGSATSAVITIKNSDEEKITLSTKGAFGGFKVVPEE